MRYSLRFRAGPSTRIKRGLGGGPKSQSETATRPARPPTEGKGLACPCGAQDRETSALCFKGARLFKCRHCHRHWTELSAWTAEEQKLWEREFPAADRKAVESDADSERGDQREAASDAAPTRDVESEASSSDAAPQTADEEPGTEDEAAVTLRAVSLLNGEQSDQSETTDEE